MIPMDSDWRAERAEERKQEREEKERKRRIRVNIAVYLIMESRMDPDSASGLGRKVASFL